MSEPIEGQIAYAEERLEHFRAQQEALSTIEGSDNLAKDFAYDIAMHVSIVYSLERLQRINACLEQQSAAQKEQEG